MSKAITVTAIINAPVTTVWQAWNDPKHIVNWAFASDDWEAPAAENDVQVGGRFKTTMAAKDGTAEFDFTGAYTAVTPEKHLAYTIDDGRTVTIDFTANGNTTTVTETFEMEHENPEEMQRGGWQAILNNFKNYIESL